MLCVVSVCVVCVHLWMSEGNLLKSVLSCYLAGSGNQTEVGRPSPQCLSPLKISIPPKLCDLCGQQEQAPNLTWVIMAPGASSTFIQGLHQCSVRDKTTSQPKGVRHTRKYTTTNWNQQKLLETELDPRDGRGGNDQSDWKVNTCRSLKDWTTIQALPGISVLF